MSAEHQGIGLKLAHAEQHTKLKLLGPVVTQNGDRAFRY